MGERINAIKYFLQKAAIQYNEPEINNISINTEDKGGLEGEYSMCYHKQSPHLKKYCGPDWTFKHWPSANIESFEKTRNEIIIESNKLPIIDKVGWYGNIYSPRSDVIEPRRT